MRIMAIIPLILAGAALPSPARAGGAEACPFHGLRLFGRMAELPAFAVRALGFPMAERGARWEVGDAIGPGPRLPSARFVSARQTGCTLEIRYEHGGIAHTWETAVLERRGIGWILVRAR